MKQFMFIIVAFAALIGAFSLMFNTGGPNVQRVTLGDRAFDIPLAYLRHGGAASPTGILLQFYYPDLRPLSSLSRSEIQHALNAERVGQALIEPPTARIGLDVNRRRPSLKYVSRLQPFNGMAHQVWHPGDLKTSSRELVYYPNTDNETGEYIICDNDDPPHPQCNYYFTHDDMFFKINFSRKKHLTRWREIRRGVEDLIKQFEVDDGYANPK